ncbi:hypothetical protein VPH35_082148 [Triticum aestivum]
MAMWRSGGAGVEGSRGNQRIRPWREADSDGAGGLRAASGAVRAQCWGRRRRTGGGRGVREAVEGREAGGGDGDRDRVLGSGEVDVGVRSVQNDEHLVELGKVTKEFIARLEARS